jgi:type IV pilus assembly protein PilA
MTNYTEKKENKMRKQKGFSLIELLIVVAIILIIAAIAIPNLLRARIAANESSAVQSIRTINTAQVTYQSQFPNVGFSSTIAALGPAAAAGCSSATAPTSTNACLLDYVLSTATAAGTPKSGYYFTLPATVAGGGITVDYTINGLPAAANSTGVRGFCSNSDGVIRYNNPAAAAATNGACAALTPLQ